MLYFKIELETQHKTTTKDLLGNLMKIVSCLQRLPVNNYLMRSKIEENCKKLYIYEESSTGKDTDREFFELETAFNRKWLAIEHLTTTFLHHKHFFAACCFPNLNLKNVHTYPSKFDAKTKVKATPKKKKRNVKKVHKKK